MLPGAKVGTGSTFGIAVADMPGSESGAITKELVLGLMLDCAIADVAKLIVGAIAVSS